MKTLDKLSIKEKASLLHELFKRDIPDLLNCIEGIAKSLLEASPEEAATWSSGLFSAQNSYTMVAEAAEKINSYKSKMYHHRKIFADQLFTGYQALFVVYCLRKCSSAAKLDNRKLQQAVELFFNN